MKTTAERRQALEDTLDRYLDELAAGDCKPSYSINGQAVQWADYRDKLHKWIEQTKEDLEMFDDDGGICEEVTTYR